MDSGHGKPWFVPKRYGYGAVPISWEGWALVAAFAVAIAALAWFVVARPAAAGQPMTFGRIAGFLVAVAILVGLLVIIAKAKTAGDWAWRSGASR